VRDLRGIVGGNSLHIGRVSASSLEGSMAGQEHESHHEHHIMGTLRRSTLQLLQDHDANEEKDEEKLWVQWDSQETPDAFGALELANDGGFSEVPGLYDNGTTMRWLNAVIMVVFVVYNVISVMKLDFDFMFRPEAAAEELNTTLPDIQKFYISKLLIQTIVWIVGGQPERVHAVRFLGFLELTGLLIILGGLAVDICKLQRERDFRRWFNVQKIFWETVPRLSVYSGMRLLYSCVPIVLTSDVCEIIDTVSQETRQRAIKTVCRWLAITIASFAVGFDMFLMKLRIVTAAAKQQELTIIDFLPTLQFLIQVVGVVQLGIYTRKRLFTFIFGGEDGVMQPEEFVKLETWNALLAKRIYGDGTSARSIVKFLVVMLSFSDMDFQSLVLNDRNAAEQKAHKAAQQSYGPLSGDEAESLKKENGQLKKQLQAYQQMFAENVNNLRQMHDTMEKLEKLHTV